MWFVKKDMKSVMQISIYCDHQNHYIPCTFIIRFLIIDIKKLSTICNLQHVIKNFSWLSNYYFLNNVCNNMFDAILQNTHTQKRLI